MILCGRFPGRHLRGASDANDRGIIDEDSVAVADWTINSSGFNDSIFNGSTNLPECLTFPKAGVSFACCQLDWLPPGITMQTACTA